MNYIRIPKAFHDYKESRKHEVPVVVEETKSHYYIDKTDPELVGFYSDADEYCYNTGSEYMGLVSSASATCKAIEKHFDIVSEKETC